MVARSSRDLLDHEAPQVEPFRLHVLGVDPIVPDVGGGHGHDLTAVGGIGQDLLVPGHGGVENHLARRGADGAEASSGKHRPVLERQNARSGHRKPAA